MTTRRGFLKGIAAAVGAVVARPKLPDWLAGKPVVEAESAIDVLETGIGQGSWRYLDNFGIPSIRVQEAIQGKVHGIGAEAEIAGRRFPVMSFSLSMAPPSMFEPAFLPEGIAMEPSADRVDLQLWTKDPDLSRFLHRLYANGGLHELNLHIADLGYKTDVRLMDITGEMQADSSYHKFDLSFKCDGPIKYTGPI